MSKYQPDYFWTGIKAFKELHKFNSILKNISSHFDRTSAGTYLTYSEDMIDIIMRQNAMSGIYLICFM